MRRVELGSGRRRQGGLLAALEVSDGLANSATLAVGKARRRLEGGEREIGLAIREVRAREATVGGDIAWVRAERALEAGSGSGVMAIEQRLARLAVRMTRLG